VSEATTRRRLAAILSADVVGYTKHMARDERGTLERLRTLREAAHSLAVAHDGRIVDAVGDNFMAEFASVVNATLFAMAATRQLQDARKNDGDGLVLRIGIHVGDILEDEDQRLYGDAVNLAARVMSVGEPGTISISNAAQIHLASRTELSTRFIGEYEVKNFARPVGIHCVDLATQAPTQRVAESPVEKSIGRPAIVILPFENMSSDTDQEFLADGLVEDLTTALASSSWFTVIARNSAFSYKGRSVKIPDVSRELGVRYVVEGSVRRAGKRVRVSVQLIEGATGHHIWAEKYDRDMDDLFVLQDELTDSICGVLVPSLTGAERKRVMSQPERDFGAWECFHRGTCHMGGLQAVGHLEARHWLQRAMELAPRWGMPYANDALALVLAITFGRIDDVVVALQQGLASAERGVQLSPHDAEAHNALGWITAFARQYERSQKAFERGIELNASMAGCYHGLGFTYSLSGRPEAAIPPLERSILLSPHDPQMHFRRGHLGQAYFQLSRYDEAIEHILAALQLKDEYGFSYLAAAACGMAGRREEGRALLERAKIRFPENTVESLRAFLSEPLYALHLEGIAQLAA
jgi:TolB-like protein/Flp pilus assembly protein TadD